MELVAYTAQEKQQLKQARDYYAKSVEEFNAEKSYYEVEPSYDSLDTIEGGKLSEGIAKGAVDFLNAIRTGGGLNPLSIQKSYPQMHSANQPIRCICPKTRSAIQIRIFRLNWTD